MNQNNTKDSRYIAVLYNTIVHKAEQLERQNSSQHLHSRTTAYTSPLIIERKMTAIYREHTA